MNIFVLTSLAVATLHVAVSPVFAHGFISRPRSRQARCAEGNVPGCGDVRYEPQSVEAPEGSFSCNGGGARFKELNNELWWRDRFSIIPDSADHFPFTWTITAAHRTTTFEYFVFPYPHESVYTMENTYGSPIAIHLASFYYINQTIPSIVTHDVPFRNYTGLRTILGRWNIIDTSNTFYSCVDIAIQGWNRSSQSVVKSTAVKDSGARIIG